MADSSQELMVATRQWFLLQTKSREELRAQHHLSNQGIDCFCPEVTLVKIVRGQRKEVREVLFPGYIFVLFDPENVSIATLRSTRGVLRMVSFGGRPAPVAFNLIEQLKERIAQDNPQVRSNIPDRGDLMEVLSGPFRGLEAVFSQLDGDRRALVLITLLNQQVAASLPISQLSESRSPR